MKKLILGAVLVVGMTAFAQSKDQKTQRISSEERIEKLTKEYDLSKDQQAKLKVLFEQKKEEIAERRAERKQHIEKRQAERENFDAQIRQVLDEKQLEKYEAKKAERIEMRKENREDAMKVRKENRSKRLEKIQK